jgi:GTPase SAR1 family protein
MESEEPMLIGFIGAPNSGKTTIAARVFAELKQNGQPDVEFIVEEARRYIAIKRAERNTDPLSDSDQETIFARQASLEGLMVGAVGPYGTVVSDSCAINSLWYMTPALRDRYMSENADYFQWLRSNALLFWCSNIGIMPQKDTLRLHDEEQSKEINRIIGDALINRSLKNLLPLHPKLLTGPIDLKVSKVVEQIYERLTR